MRLRPFILPAALLGSLLAAPALPAADAVNQANPGQPVEIGSVLKKTASTKFFIVDFYSKYCPPCMRISPMLEQLGEKRPDLKVVKLDINRPDVQGIDWQSPLAEQYKLQSIPHFKIYDGSGKLVQEGDGAYKQVLDWLKQANLNL